MHAFSIHWMRGRWRQTDSQRNRDRHTCSHAHTQRDTSTKQKQKYGSNFHRELNLFVLIVPKFFAFLSVFPKQVNETTFLKTGIINFTIRRLGPHTVCLKGVLLLLMGESQAFSLQSSKIELKFSVCWYKVCFLNFFNNYLDSLSILKI